MWFLENLQIVSFIKPSVCKIVVWPAWTDETSTVPEFPPIHLSKVSSQNSATLSAARLAAFSWAKQLAFKITTTACCADFLH